MKYIDADLLRTEIERLKIKACGSQATEEEIVAALSSLDLVIRFLDTLQEPENPIYELNQFLINWVRDGQTDAEKDARWEAYRRFFELHDEAMTQEPNAADKKAVKEIVKITHKEVTRQIKEMVEGLQEPGDLEKKECELVTADEDIITIHLGKVLTEKQYDAVLRSVIDHLNKHWWHILRWSS